MTNPVDENLDRLLYGEVRLKVWVPEPVFQALTLLADDADLSRATLIRHVFIKHIFGRACLEAALITQANRPQVLFSMEPCEDSDERLPLGKSTVDAVILVAGEVGWGLRHLAEVANMPLGTYARHVLCWEAFGHGVHASTALQATMGYWLGDETDIADQTGATT